MEHQAEVERVNRRYYQLKLQVVGISANRSRTIPTGQMGYCCTGTADSGGAAHGATQIDIFNK
jgi:hypothetical protein